MGKYQRVHTVDLTVRVFVDDHERMGSETAANLLVTNLLGDEMDVRVLGWTEE